MFRKVLLWSLFILLIAVVLSISFTTDSVQTLEAKKDDLGFKVLFLGENPTVDIVAIHGLDGHREKSWTSKNGTMWLKDLLPEDTPTARILTYGFDADTRSFTQTSTLNIFRHAEAFVQGLSQIRKEDPERPLIFLAHSLGGIILKKALARCHATSFNSPSHRAIKVSTHAVLFFGTPHSGANGIQLAQWLGRLSSVHMYTSRTVLEDLSRNSPELESIQDSYLHASDDIKTIFFYEEYRTPLYWWFSEMIVPRHLATIQGDRNAEVVVLHADHIQMVKFGRRSDSDYGRVAEYLVDLLKDATAKVEQNWIREGGHRTVEKEESNRPQLTGLAKPRPPVSRNYVERPQIQNLLTRNLLPSSLPKHQPRCVLHGLAGSGKTQLASFWIEKNQNSFRKIIYIDAISQYQIEADLETVIKSVDVRYSKATWRDAVAYLTHTKEWILFFDNADAPDLGLDKYLPDSPHGVVLITTRNRDTTHYAQCRIHVGDLSEGEALDVLHAVADIHPPSHNSSIAIVNELGRLALPVTHAGAYIFNTGSFDMYLSILRKHRDWLMRDASFIGRNYNWSTYAAFEMSFNQLPAKSRKFMSICAFLHHSLIPRALFENSTASQFRSHFDITGYPPPKDSKTLASDLEDLLGSEWDEFEFQNLIHPIIQHSLMDTATDEHRHSFYNIHPLVQTFIQDLHTEAEKDCYALLAGQLLLGAIGSVQPGENINWHRQLSPHIDKLPVKVRQAHVVHSRAFAEVYKSVGNWNATLSLRKYICTQFAEVLGRRHSVTISAMNDLGITLRDCGQLEEAERIQREVLVVWKEVLGMRHPHTILAMNNLSTTLRDRGQLEEAERMQREVLEVRKEVLGMGHPHTILAMNNLSATLRDRGQLEEAERMQRKVLEVRKEDLGLRHPDTIAVMSNLALTLCARGRLEEAEMLQREVLEVRKEVLGLRHPSTITAMNNLGLTLRERGQLEEAERMRREVFEVRKEILGLRHPDTILAMSNLGAILCARGQLEEAERMQREVLVVWKEVLGMRHPHTILAMNNLSTTLRDRGQLEEAETLQREVLEVRKEVLGLRHPDTIAAMSNLGLTLRARGQLEVAERMQREFLVLRKEEL